MMYALNLAEDGRILSATYPQYAPVGAVIMDVLPDGDIYEYRYVNGEYVHDPLPKPEEPEQPEHTPTAEERIAQLEAENKTLTAQVDALSGQLDFQEECIVEMANIIYA